VAVDIEIFGQLLPNQPRRQTVDIKESVSVGELAKMIGLELEEIGLVTIDGVQSDLEHSVQPDSRLCFFPYVSGG
jgi:hypothetical protein